MDTRQLMTGERLKASDVQPHEPVRLTVATFQVEELTDRGSNEKRPKGVLYFRGTEKSLPLNKTNLEAMQNLYGFESDAWVGQKVQLITVPTNKGPGIRIVAIPEATSQASPPAAAADAPPNAELERELPF